VTWDARTLDSFDEHLHRAVRQLEHLEDVGDRADVVEILGTGFILGGRLLGDKKNALAGFHGGFECLDGLRTSDEQRDHHVREDHDVPQRKQRKRQLVLLRI
jgi:hypothetical protein